jgi:tetratricopeptide (TPR) repeat protein
MKAASADATSLLIQSLEKRMVVNPFSPSFSRLASLYLSGNRLEEARILCEKGVAHYPRYATAHLVLGHCYLRLQRFSDARREFKEALNLQPRCETARTLLQEMILRSTTDSTIETAAVEDQVQASPGEPLDEKFQPISGAAADEIVTATLAEIYATQGAYQEAIRTYALLVRRRPQEREHFERRIRELEEIWRSVTPPN